jgi:hypothetical protein
MQRARWQEGWLGRLTVAVEVLAGPFSIWRKRLCRERCSGNAISLQCPRAEVRELAALRAKWPPGVVFP